MRRLAWALSTCCALLSALDPVHAQPAPAAPPAPTSAPSDANTWQPPPPAWQTGPYLPPPMAQAPAGALPYDPRTVAARYELLRIDEELARLRAARPRLFWPVTIVAVGGSVALFHGLMGLTLWATSRHQRYGWDQQGNRYEYTYVDPDDRAGAREAAGAFGIGLAIAAGGLLLLVPRLKVRSELNRQARGLRERRLQLIRQVSYSLNTDNGRAGLTASLRF